MDHRSTIVSLVGDACLHDRCTAAELINHVELTISENAVTVVVSGHGEGSGIQILSSSDPAVVAFVRSISKARLETQPGFCVERPLSMS